MEIVNRLLTRDQFTEYVKTFNFATLNPTKLVIHHTWRPTRDQWQGQRSINGLKSFYEKKGWTSGPHLFVADDGIWLFSPMNKMGTHAGKGNTASIGIEVVGDYDSAVWEGETHKNAVHVIATLMDRLDIGNEGIKRHNDYSTKTCPGRMITKEWIISQLPDNSLMRSLLEDRLKKAMETAQAAVRKLNDERRRLAEAKGTEFFQYRIIDTKK